MIVYRLAVEKYADDLSGIGAELVGGRWNYKGTRVLYTSDSRALCTAEIAVHTPIGMVPSNYYLISIEVPDDAEFNEVELNELPSSWKNFPHSNVTQDVGEQFVLEGKYLFLKVPSAVVQGDFNFILNPKHPRFSDVKVVSKEKFSFDKRLFNPALREK